MPLRATPSSFSFSYRSPTFLVPSHSEPTRNPPLFSARRAAAVMATVPNNGTSAFLSAATSGGAAFDSTAAGADGSATATNTYTAAKAASPLNDGLGHTSTEGNAASVDEPSNMPRLARIVNLLVQIAGINETEPAVLPQLLEFAHSMFDDLFLFLHTRFYI